MEPPQFSTERLPYPPALAGPHSTRCGLFQVLFRVHDSPLRGLCVRTTESPRNLSVRLEEVSIPESGRVVCC